MKIDKPWGYEIIWAKTDKYVGKILFIKSGESLSLQHHDIKEETIMVIEGKVSVRIMDSFQDSTPENERFVLLEDYQTLHIPPKMIHQFSSVDGDAKIIEVSTSELDDIVRHQDRYGRIQK